MNAFIVKFYYLNFIRRIKQNLLFFYMHIKLFKKIALDSSQKVDCGIFIRKYSAKNELQRE